MADILLKGSKGGSTSFQQTPDNLRSNDTFEGVLGVAIGPLKGPTRGLKSVKLDGTAVENETGELNFGDFVVTVGNGDPTAFPQPIQLKLGAGAAPTSVNTSITNSNTSGPGVWSTKTLNNTNADFIDFRFIVNQLYRQDKSGIYTTTATLEIQMKPVGSTTWINPTLNTPNATYNEQGINTPGYQGAVLKTYLPEEYFDNSGAWTPQPSNYAITGKTSSPSVYQLRIGVPNEGKYANTAWDLRVRLIEKDSIDADPNFEKRTITWESISAVYSTVLGVAEDWRGVGWMQLYGKASDQLTGVPEVTGEWDTKIVSVPPQSVFDPDSRAYTTAIWDGSWTKAFTNDPAWVISDAISDSLSGLSLIATGSYLNKWDALEASKWCSAQVPDGNGGTQPRYSMNIAISEVQKAEDFIRYLSGGVGGLAWDQGDGQWRMKVDKPEAPVDLFTLDNIEGEFLWSGTDVDTRFNDITGSFKNAEMDYRQDRVRLYDNQSIANLGRKPTNVVLVGCTNRQEAMRRLKLRILSTVNEFRIVNFTTNRRGRNINMLDTILVADGDMADRSKPTTGRMSLANGNTQKIVFRDPIYLPSGTTYNLKFTVPNPNYNPDTTTQPLVDWTKPTIVVNALIGSNSSNYDQSTTTLYIDPSTPLPADLPDNTSFAIDAPTLPVMPKLMRVTNVVVADDGERIQISALEIYTPKWNLADNVSKSDTVFQDLRGPVPVPLPPIGGNVLSLVRVPVQQGTQVNLVANWIRPVGAQISGFRISYRINGGAWQTPQENTQFTTFELVNPAPGDYDFEIATLDRMGNVSEPLHGFLTVTQDILDATQIKYASSGDTLQALKPQEAGANVTENRTSADTGKVAGTPSTVVLTNIASNTSAISSVTAKQSATDQTVSVIQMALSQTNNDLSAARTQLSSDIAKAQADATAGRAAAAQAQSDLSNEVTRAKADVASARSDLGLAISTAQGTANQARSESAQVRTDLTAAASAAQQTANQARSDAASVSTTLANEVSRAQGAEGTINTTITNLTQTVNGNTSAITSETTQRVTADGALSNRIDTVSSATGANTSAISTNYTTLTNADMALSSRIDTVTSTANGNTSAIRDEASTRALADSSLSTRASVLESTARPSGNLLPNTAFSTLDGWSIDYNVNNAGYITQDGAGTQWMLGNVEHNLCLRYPSGSGYLLEAVSTPFALHAGDTIQFSVLAASHRSYAWASLYFYDGYGNQVGYAGENRIPRINAGGNNLDNWDRLGAQSFLVPANTVNARMVFRLYDVQNDGFAWFTRPFVGIVQPGTNTWLAYTPGNDRPVTSANTARISLEETTRTNADSALSTRIDTVTSTANGNTATISANYLTLTNADMALSNRIDTVTSTVSGHTATISSNYTTLSNADMALSGRIDSVTATANGNTSAISNESIARANADQSLVSQISSLTTNYQYADANLQTNITNEVTARSNADIALANRASALESTVSVTPTSFFARSAGYGSGYPNGPTGVTKADGTTYLSGGGRSYTVSIFNLNSNVLGYSQAFDVYGDPAQATAMANLLNNINAGQAVIVTTNDEPATNRLSNGLQAAMERCGSGDVFAQAVPFHGAYILIGKAGIGRGNGREYVDPVSVEQRFDMLLGKPVMGSGAQSALITARIGLEETTRATADSALSTRVDNLSATVGSNTSAINSEAITRASADGALGGRIDTVTATANGNSTAISNEVTARANAVSALANRTSSLETTTNTVGNGLALNDHFSAWTDPNLLPSYWGNWVTEGNFRTARVAGQGSSYGLQLLCDSSDAYHDGVLQYVSVIPGWYVMEVTARLDANVINGAGVTLFGQYSINFATTPDVNGVAGGSTVGQTRSWSVIFNNTNLSGSVPFHLMLNWTEGFGQAPKYLTFFRATIRPASDAEIKAQRAFSTDIPNAVARISTEETTRTNADLALSSRIDSLTTTVGNNTSAITNESATRASADMALANRTSTLESTTNTVGATLTQNERFSAWPDPAGLPAYWTVWKADGNFRTARLGGMASPYAVQLLNDTANANSGLVQSTTYMTYGWYVMEVTARLDANVIDGAGLTLHGQYSIDFLTDTDNNGITGGSASGQTRTWTKIFKNTTLNGDNYNLHTMLGWDGFNHPIAPKYVTFFHASVRPASDAEIKAQKAFSTDIPNTIARISTEETTRTNADLALSSRIDTVTSTANGNTSTISANYLTLSNADMALSSRIDSVTATANGNSTAINNEVTARANADNALSTRTSSLESTSNGGQNNSINANPTFTAWPAGQALPTYWDFWADGRNVERGGPENNAGQSVLFHAAQGVQTGMQTQRLYLAAGWYVVEAEVFNSGNWDGSGLSINGQYNWPFSVNPDTNGVVAGTGGPSRRKFSFIYQLPQLDACILYAMASWDGHGARAAKDMYFNRVAIRAASDAEIKAQKSFSTDMPNTIARISLEESTRAGAVSGLATQISNVITSYQNADSTLQTNITNATTSLSNATQAVANRTTTLEATSNAFGSAAVNPNPRFSVWVNPDNQPPYFWTWWQQNGTIQRYGNDRNQGGNLCQLTATSTAQHGIYVPNVYFTKGQYILDADVYCNGSWNGSGVTLQGIYNFDFTTMADTNGVVGDTGAGSRKFSQLFTVNYDGTLNVHAMVNWSDGFKKSAAKTMNWYNLSVRPASDAEIQAGRATGNIASLTSRITTAESTIISNNTAIANRTSALETTAGNLSSRVSVNESSISSLNGRTAAYWQVSAVAGNNRAQITVKADANGGAGVDITGDVTFYGNLNVASGTSGGRMAITNQQIVVYDDNGVARVIIGKLS